MCKKHSCAPIRLDVSTLGSHGVSSDEQTLNLLIALWIIQASSV